MTLKIKFIFALLLVLFISNTIIAQDFWKKIDNNSYAQKKEIHKIKNFPEAYKLASLDLFNFQKYLDNKTSEQIITLPNTNGTFSEFSIKESSNFNIELAKKFPTIKSYAAQGIDDPTAVAKISIGTDGLHAIIFSGNESTIYIDPYSKDNNDYIVYNRSSLVKKNSEFKCEVEQASNAVISQQNFSRNANDGMLRTFRLAIVCSGEYAQFHLTRQDVPSTATDIVKKAAVLSAINTSMTRINGVFEKDLGVHMELVANNEEIIFLDADNDNISDGSAGTMISEVQSICDASIGDENYDIGHIFSIGGSGLAGLGVVCITGQKARGVTGISTPVGDPYDIDYVSHEMGHQFGANHTQNNDCNRNDSTAVEPGSASTIMGYAGICAPNVQNKSDDHFHTVSITEMWNTIQSSATCAVVFDTSNEAPTADAGDDFNIPKSTPFVLRGAATDADGTSSLTYNWEQVDAEVATMSPLPTNTEGPMFRSLRSKSSPDRYMPDLSTIISGNISSTWEVLPSVPRDLNFSFLVRDNNAGGGNTARDNVKVTITDAEAFMVTSQSTNATLYTGSSRAITWVKGTTDLAPINCANVNIKLSIDGGLTFPIMLKENTPNDGIEDIIVPNSATTSARILVEAANNIFYNVNASNFTIDATTSTFLVNNTSGEQGVCNFGNESASYNLNLDFVNGFSESVSLTASGQPSGASVVFSPATVNSDENVVMTVTNLDGATAQMYTINVQATSTTLTKSANVNLNLTEQVASLLTLVSPVNGVINTSLTQTLSWNEDSNATSYDIEIASDVNFTNLLYSDNVTVNYYVPANLIEDTLYYWRVVAKNNCSESNYSSTFSFTTITCNTCISFGETSYATSTTLVQFNTINNISEKPSGYGDYTAINTVVKLNESHDLTVNVNTDGSYRVQVKAWIDWNQNCSFDDDGEEYDLGFAYNTTDDPTDLSPLSITVPSGANIGNTVMRVSSRYTNSTITYPSSCMEGFDGEVEDYTIIVEDVTASIEDFSFNGFNIYPNPTKGTFTLNLEVVNTAKVSVQLYDVRGRLIGEKNYFNTNINFSESVFFEKAGTGLYLVKITNGNKQTTRKILIK
jgi:hypothetical protein